MVGEHDRVGPYEAEQLAEEERRGDARGAAHARMGDEGVPGFSCTSRQKFEAGDHRRDHDGIEHGGLRGGDLATHAIELARQARHVAGAAPGPLDAAQRRRDRSRRCANGE